MKVAVSIPDSLYEAADQLARQRGLDRSALYARALSRFLADEDGDVLTDMINATCAETGREDLAELASADLLDSGSWEW